MGELASAQATESRKLTSFPLHIIILPPKNLQFPCSSRIPLQNFTFITPNILPEGNGCLRGTIVKDIEANREECVWECANVYQVRSLREITGRETACRGDGDD